MTQPDMILCSMFKWYVDKPQQNRASRHRQKEKAQADLTEESKSNSCLG